MKESKQETIRIGQVNIPTIKEEDDTWYPISRICEKILLKNTPSTKELNKNYNTYISKQTIDFTYLNPNHHKSIQETNCFNQEGLELFIKNSNPRRLNENQKNGLNLVKEYLHIPIMENKSVQIFDKNKLNEILKTHNKFIQDCIIELIEDKELNTIQWQQCTKCNKWFPLDEKFYLTGGNTGNIGKYNYLPSCKNCHDNKSIHILQNNEDLNKIYYTYGLDVYKLYKSHNTIEIYQHFKSNDIKYPKIISNKEDYLYIIKYYYDIGVIDKDKLTIDYLKDTLDFPCMFQFKSKISSYDIYSYLFNNDFEYYPWKYKSLFLRKDYNINDGVIAAKNYVSENNIIVNNPLEFNYQDLLRKSRLTKFEKDILLFAEVFNDYKYPAYKFKIHSVNYWKNEDNRIKNLKYYIEQDIKIPIEKIPLYLTKWSLNKNSNTLYNILYLHDYYKNLFEWVDSCYPHRFILADFEINPYRCEFDSIEESQIYDILKNTYKNTIYNQRNTDNTITINGMIPDFIILTDNNTYLIEYFGLYVENKRNNKRVNDYRKKTEEKINKYNRLDNYKTIFLYPSDLNDNFKGLYEKIKGIN